MSALAPTCSGHDPEPCHCLFLPIIPCNSACVWYFENPPKNVSISPPPLHSFPQLPITQSDKSSTLPKHSFLSFFNLTTPVSSTVCPSLVRKGEEGWLTGASIHTPKSAKARRWHRQKNNKSLPNHGRGSAALYLQRQNKGRPVEHSDCVYFQGGNNDFKRRGQGLMWHLRASPKKQHFILIHSEFKKTSVAVQSIGVGEFECEEEADGG